ncbi:MAG: GGDEF domain-containing protein [Bradyrhizobium sp.]|uniref:GGDEF domain-containing protein n=1 Tax=Bradyrhizobium sp. TaxID=376 RepID=UPI0027160595|nr:GGDEF domain-containing protein [Bradyrhizobium sp.]MDO8399365.1 GGDEF domain-containing protein [Bradyrhizobium sp.]
MSQQSVPATPSNFSVWFEYAMGTSPALRKTIDILIGNKRKFDAAINYELYVTYVNPQYGLAVKGDFPERLRGVITNATQFLTTAIADNRTQIEALGEVSSEAQASGDPQAIIERLVTELSNATARATALELNFEASTQELDRIRNSLKEAEQRSNTDALTGLANRRSLDEFLRSAQIVAMEKGEPLSVLLIDIDHFKDFNDTFGHQVGDQVLRLVAKVLQENVRDQDLAARYGGEELFAVLPGADLDVCAGVAERIRGRISDARLTRRTTGLEISSVTVSIGVAQFKLAESAEAMIERCDRALYRAKRSGRNKTVTENDIEGEVVAAA